MLGAQEEHRLYWETWELEKGSWRRGPHPEALGDGQCQVSYLEEETGPSARGASRRGGQGPRVQAEAVWVLSMGPAATLPLGLGPESAHASLQPLTGVGGCQEASVRSYL